MPRTLPRTAFHKRARVTVLAAGLVCAAAACDGSGGNDQHTPTTVATQRPVAASPSAPATAAAAFTEADVGGIAPLAENDQHTPTTVATQRPVAASPSAPVTTAAAFTEADVGGIAPLAEDVARLLKLPVVTRDIAHDLGQEFEGVKLERFGFVDGWTVFYRVGAADPAVLEGAWIGFAFLDTTEHAASTLAGAFGNGGLQPGDGLTAELGADEAGAISGSTTVSGIFMRKGRVVATIVVLHAEGFDIDGGLRELAALVAQRIAAFESSIP